MGKRIIESSMKDLLSKIVLVTLLLLPFPLFADDGEPGREIEIHETSESVGRPRVPDYGLEITCYIADNELLLFTSYPEWLQVEIRNNTTGAYQTSHLVCSAEGVVIPLYEDGSYEISIRTSIGRTFSGYFNK